MIRVLTDINRRVESFLFRRGFDNPDVRWLVRVQLYLATVGGVFGLVFSPLGWGMGFAAGAALATFNFYSLARIVQQIIFVRKGALASLLFSFYARLILTGLVLFGLIVWAKVSIFALLAGLTTLIVTILMWGVFFVLGKQ